MSISWKDVEREYLLRLIIDLEGDVSHMVRVSKLSRATIYNKIRRYDLENDLNIARMTASKRAIKSGEDSSGGIQ